MRRIPLLLVLLGGVACGDPIVTGRPDVSLFDGFVPVPDAPPVDGGTSDDLDGDGLCNDTEAQRGSDPLRADSDDDGIPDGAEVALGYDPIRGESPGRDNVQILREAAASTVDVLIERDVFAEGQDLVGAFEPSPVSDMANQDAATFYRSAIAAFASPTTNFASIDGPAQTVRGVTGRVLVGYELRFEYGDALVRGCVRAYPYRYTIKRSDTVIVAVESRALLIVPPGETLATAEWCAVSSCR